jgi:hypothetical protein
VWIGCEVGGYGVWVGWVGFDPTSVKRNLCVTNQYQARLCGSRTALLLLAFPEIILFPKAQKGERGEREGSEKPNLTTRGPNPFHLLCIIIWAIPCELLRSLKVT